MTLDFAKTMWRPSGDQSGIVPLLVTGVLVPSISRRQAIENPFEVSRCASSGEKAKKFALPMSGPLKELTTVLVVTLRTS